MYKNFYLLTLKSNLVNEFFNNVASTLVATFQLGHSMYIFSKYTFFNMFWKLNLSKIFVKTGGSLKFKKLTMFFLYKYNIKTIVSINFQFFRYLKFINQINIKKIGIIDNSEAANYFHYHLILPSMSFINQTIFYHFLINTYLQHLQSKKNNVKQISLQRLLNYKN
jgi:hypothetical protein